MLMLSRLGVLSRVLPMGADCRNPSRSRTKRCTGNYSACSSSQRPTNKKLTGCQAILDKERLALQKFRR